MTNETAATSIDGFLSAVAARQPTPGGGAVSALCGALAAAIGEMVLNYSIGRKATPQFDAPLSAVVGEFTIARAMMLELMVEDQQAFTELTAAKKLDGSDPLRSERIAIAAEACIAVPRAIAATSALLVERAERVVEMANKFLLSDLAVCVELAMATLRSAIHCVRVNLPDQPESKRKAIGSECDAELARAVNAVQRVMQQITQASRL